MSKSHLDKHDEENNSHLDKYDEENKSLDKHDEEKNRSSSHGKVYVCQRDLLLTTTPSETCWCLYTVYFHHYSQWNMLMPIYSMFQL